MELKRSKKFSMFIDSQRAGAVKSRSEERLHSMPEKKMGTFYGIGVGPGDPGLLTVRAVEILREAKVVFAASSPKNDYSMALNIAREHLNGEVDIRFLNFPMVRDPGELEQAWSENARRVLGTLESGRDAVFVTIGDPLTYSTYGYLMRTILEMAPDTPIETIPGITAYQAAASRLNVPLMEAEEALVVVSGVAGSEEVKRIAKCAENLVIMKAYRNFDEIVDALESLPESRDIYVVSHCGLDNEMVCRDARQLRGEKMPYMSLLIAKRTESKTD